MDFPQARDVPYLTAEQMREVDRAMMEEYGIELIQMMENAGRALASLARARFLGGDPRRKRVVVLAGTGGNGGGALAGARHLHNYGADVLVVVTDDDEAFAPAPRRQLEILRRMQVPVTHTETPVQTHPPGAAPPALIVDGIIGYSLQGAPRGAAAELIRWANGAGAPVLALDTPSGVDSTSGIVFDPAIRATATMTLALPKTGLRAAAAAAGELYLADISVPPGLYARFGLDVGPIFAKSELVRLG
jgi:NAD(P)H-hydrate epimerase